EYELGGSVEFNSEDSAVTRIELALQLPRPCMPDLHCAIATRCDDELTIRRDGHGVDRLSGLAQPPNPCAARNLPDRRVTVDATGHKTRRGWIEGKATNPRDRANLCPGARVEHVHLLTPGRRKPVVVG